MPTERRPGYRGQELARPDSSPASARAAADSSGVICSIDARVTRGFGAAIHHLHALDALDTMGSLDIRTSLDAS